jgi:hypothetical protein
MAQFHISFMDDGGVVTAPKAISAPDVLEAQRVGLRAAGEIITEALVAGETIISFTLSICDEQQNVVATIPVRTTAVELPAQRLRLIYSDL